MQVAIASEAKSTHQKSARIELKTTSDVKGALEQAALESGVTLTAFIVAQAYEQAKRVLEAGNTTRLNQQAWAALDQAITQPAKAPQALRDLMQR